MCPECRVPSTWHMLGLRGKPPVTSRQASFPDIETKPSWDLVLQQLRGQPGL